MYLTYEEYAQRGGTLPEAEFGPAEFRARKRVDWLTDGRVAAMATVPEAVKAAMMAIIRVDAAAGAEAQVGAPLVVSFNTDGYSESYGSAENRTATLEKQLSAEVCQLLYRVKDDDGVPILYRGVI